MASIKRQESQEREALRPPAEPKSRTRGPSGGIRAAEGGLSLGTGSCPSWQRLNEFAKAAAAGQFVERVSQLLSKGKDLAPIGDSRAIRT